MTKKNNCLSSPNLTINNGPRHLSPMLYLPSTHHYGVTCSFWHHYIFFLVVFLFLFAFSFSDVLDYNLFIDSGSPDSYLTSDVTNIFSNESLFNVSLNVNTSDLTNGTNYNDEALGEVIIMAITSLVLGLMILVTVIGEIKFTINWQKKKTTISCRIWMVCLCVCVFLLSFVFTIQKNGSLTSCR
jgi:uncharacterized membrane protein YdbT with pleckstrin-like domain